MGKGGLSRIFDLLCVRSYDFILWWFDIDFILYDFVFDYIVCITLIFAFVIGFFLRIFYSFIFVILFMCFWAQYQSTLLYTGFNMIFISIFYNFVCFFFAFGISYILNYIEFFTFTSLFIFTDFVSFSQNTTLFTGSTAPFSVFFCSYLFCLFYFVVYFIFCFVFFVIRCLFSISFDIATTNFDLQCSILSIDIKYFDFLCFLLVYLGYLFANQQGFFSFIFILSFTFLIIFFILSIFFAFSFLCQNHSLIKLCTINFWYFLIYARSFTIMYPSNLRFFKNVYSDIFFIFLFLLIIFVVSFFGFFIKDFLFLTVFFELFLDIICYDTKPIQAFISNRNYNNITQMLTIYA